MSAAAVQTPPPLQVEEREKPANHNLLSTLKATSERIKQIQITGADNHEERADSSYKIDKIVREHSPSAAACALSMFSSLEKAEGRFAGRCDARFCQFCDLRCFVPKILRYDGTQLLICCEFGPRFASAAARLAGEPSLLLTATRAQLARDTWRLLGARHDIGHRILDIRAALLPPD
jgi:hypothetical protein